MIVLDIETSGVNSGENGIWQIGAFDIENPNNCFLEEARIDESDSIQEEALLVTGKSREELLDKNKQSQKDLLVKFFGWCKNVNIKNCLCQNPQFDLGFVTLKARKYGLELPFHHRAFDLHSMAQMKYYLIKKEFLFKENHSDMGLKNILEFCGILDPRGAHNALEDCRLTGECFSRIIYKKNIFPEYSKFPIPEYLKK